jgi:hypothetical protein
MVGWPTGRSVWALRVDHARVREGLEQAVWQINASVAFFEAKTAGEFAGCDALGVRSRSAISRLPPKRRMRVRRRTRSTFGNETRLNRCCRNRTEAVLLTKAEGAQRQEGDGAWE